MAAKKSSAKMKRKSMKKKLMSNPGKAPSIKDPLTKGALTKAIMDMTDLAKKEVSAVLESLNTLIELHIKTRGPGKFVLPGLLKINVVKKPARPARKGINPFTGEEMMFKAKPAMRVVKIRPLKNLKEVAAG